MSVQAWQKETFLLTNENINKATKRISNELEQYDEKPDCLRLCLAFEDILNTWQCVLGEHTECTIRYGKRFGSWNLRLTATGVSIDPNNDSSTTDMEVAGNVILQGMGLYPAFEYKNGVNHITLCLPKKKPNQLIYLFGAGVIAVILGLFSLNAPSDIKTVLVEELAMPVLDMLMGILSGVAMPMIFLSITIGVVNMGNIAALGRIGNKFLSRFLAITFAAPILSVLLFLFTVKFSAENIEVGGFHTILAMLLDIIPKNIVTPFIDGNSIQIIFLGFCLGVALLMLGSRTQTLTDGMKQLQAVTNIFMDGITRLLPLFVFLTFYGITASGSVGKLGGIAKISVMIVVAMLFTTSCTTAYFCWRMHVPVRVLIKKIMPSFLVALSTASTLASFSMRVECCKKDLGLDSKITDFAVPLAQALLKSEAGILYVLSALCVAGIYNVAITPMWIVMCCLVSSLLAIATPPIPGGSQIVYAALFLQLGIPPEGLVLALAADIVLDFADTALCCYTQMLTIVLIADKLGKVDKDILRSSKPALTT